LQPVSSALQVADLVVRQAGRQRAALQLVAPERHQEVRREAVVVQRRLVDQAVQRVAEVAGSSCGLAVVRWRRWWR
jgi:hypothetical protein